MIVATMILGLAVPALGGGEEDLLRVLERTAERRREDGLRDLVALGDAGLPQVFALVSGTALEPLLASERQLLVDPDDLDDLGLEALTRLPQKSVLSYLQLAGGPEATPAERIAVVRGLGALGTSLGLATLVDQIEALGPAAAAGSTASHVAPALTRILLDDPHGFRVLEQELATTDEPTRLLLLSSLGSVPHGSAAELLLKHLGADPGRDALLIRTYSELCSENPWILRRDPLEPLIALSRSQDAGVRLEAVQGLRRFPGPKAAAALIARLEDERPRVSSVAGKALVEHFGLRKGLDAKGWKELLEKERGFWNERAPELLRQLANEETGVSTAALRTLLEHPLYREEVALHLTDALDHAAEESVPGLVGLLAKLGARSSVPELVERLGSSNRDVRRACHAALERLTGWGLPAEPMVWQRRVHRG